MREWCPQLVPVSHGFEPLLKSQQSTRTGRSPQATLDKPSIDTSPLRSGFHSSRNSGAEPGDSPWVGTRVLWWINLGKTRGQSLGICMGFPSDLLAECREQQVTIQTRSTALRVRFIVGDREITKGFLCQIHHLPPLFLHNACSVPRRNDLC